MRNFTLPGPLKIYNNTDAGEENENLLFTCDNLTIMDKDQTQNSQNKLVQDKRDRRMCKNSVFLCVKLKLICSTIGLLVISGKTIFGKTLNNRVHFLKSI